jgi:transposase
MISRLISRVLSREKKEVPQPPLPEKVRGELSEEVQEYISDLELELAKVRAENEKLKGQLLMRSHNSSKPPSSDGLQKRPVIPGSQRRSTGRKPGGQPGHRGATLLPRAKPDRVELHAVIRCECGCDLSGRRPDDIRVSQAFDLPVTPIEVTEHRREVKICPNCRTQVTAALPPGLKGAPAEYGPRIKAYTMYLGNQHLIPVRRISEIVRELFDVEISIGSLTRWSEEAFRGLSAFERDVKAALIQSPAVNFDETGMRCEGALHWLHSASTAELTFFGIHAERGVVAMNEFGILPHFRGVAVHDHWKSYFRFEDCLHSLCNAHILRELTFLEEVFGERWAGKMRKLLIAINDAVKATKAEGRTALPRSVKKQFLRAYEKTLRSGFRFHAETDPIFKAGKRGRTQQTKGKNLLDRLRGFQTEVLRFMKNFSVPFTNNQGEQDIRMNKVKQKISGCFRSFIGARVFCRIRSYFSTMRKQGENLLEAIHAVFLGQPLPIALAAP